MVERFMAFCVLVMAKEFLIFTFIQETSNQVTYFTKNTYSFQTEKIRVANRDKPFSSLEHVFSLVP